MKLIEAMKRVKQNKEKISDLQKKASAVSANLSFETPLYGEKTAEYIQEWVQSASDLNQDNVKLLVAIARTNLVTPVTITLGEKAVTPAELRQLGRNRHGEHWHRPLAAEIGVHRTTVLKWAANKHPIPTGAAILLRRL